MQAIETKILPATNTRGTRIKAMCARGSVISPLGNKSLEEDHILAAALLKSVFAEEDRKKYGTPPAKNPWTMPTACGCLPNGNYAHVFVGEYDSNQHYPKPA